MEDTEFYEALQRGVVDAIHARPDHHTLGYPEIVKYQIGPSYKTVSHTSVTMNLDAWNSLSPELQNVVNEVMNMTYRDGIPRDYGLVGLLQKIWEDAGVEMVMPFKGTDIDLEEMYMNIAVVERTKDLVSPEVFEKIIELSKS